MPLESFCWNIGRVEMMRQSVDTTTNRQDTTATTYSTQEQIKGQSHEKIAWKRDCQVIENNKEACPVCLVKISIKLIKNFSKILDRFSAAFGNAMLLARC